MRLGSCRASELIHDPFGPEPPWRKPCAVQVVGRCSPNCIGRKPLRSSPGHTSLGHVIKLWLPSKEPLSSFKEDVEVLVSPMSATTATSGSAAYWGLGTGPKGEPPVDFIYLRRGMSCISSQLLRPMQQLRQQWEAREEELASTKASSDLKGAGS